MRSYILLDRSGSMASRWVEVVGTLDHYVEKLPADTKVTLLAFDQEFTVIHDDKVAPKGGFKGPMREARIGPRGQTALYDAMAKLAEHVAKTAKKKAQIVILTDGQENASREVNKASAGGFVSGWKERGFDVIFLGADFDAFSEAGKIGVSAGDTISYGTQNFADMGQAMATRAADYAATGQSRAWTDEERKKVGS